MRRIYSITAGSLAALLFLSPPILYAESTRSCLAPSLNTSLEGTIKQALPEELKVTPLITLADFEQFIRFLDDDPEFHALNLAGISWQLEENVLFGVQFKQGQRVISVDKKLLGLGLSDKTFKRLLKGLLFQVRNEARFQEIIFSEREQILVRGLGFVEALEYLAADQHVRSELIRDEELKKIESLAWLSEVLSYLNAANRVWDDETVTSIFRKMLKFQPEARIWFMGDYDIAFYKLESAWDSLLRQRDLLQMLEPGEVLTDDGAAWKLLDKIKQRVAQDLNNKQNIDFSGLNPILTKLKEELPFLVSEEQDKFNWTQKKFSQTYHRFIQAVADYGAGTGNLDQLLGEYRTLVDNDWVDRNGIWRQQLQKWGESIPFIHDFLEMESQFFHLDAGISMSEKIRLLHAFEALLFKWRTSSSIDHLPSLEGGSFWKQHLEIIYYALLKQMTLSVAEDSEDAFFIFTESDKKDIYDRSNVQKERLLTTLKNQEIKKVIWLGQPSFFAALFSETRWLEDTRITGPFDFSKVQILLVNHQPFLSGGEFFELEFSRILKEADIPMAALLPAREILDTHSLWQSSFLSSEEVISLIKNQNKLSEFLLSILRRVYRKEKEWEQRISALKDRKDDLIERRGALSRAEQAELDNMEGEDYFLGIERGRQMESVSLLFQRLNNEELTIFLSQYYETVSNEEGVHLFPVLQQLICAKYQTEDDVLAATLLALYLNGKEPVLQKMVFRDLLKLSHEDVFNMILEMGRPGIVLDETQSRLLLKLFASLEMDDINEGFIGKLLDILARENPAQRSFAWGALTYLLTRNIKMGYVRVRSKNSFDDCLLPLVLASKHGGLPYQLIRFLYQALPGQSGKTNLYRSEIIRLTIQLDGNAHTPGRNGVSYFTSLRSRFHSSPGNSGHRDLIKTILEYWESPRPAAVVQHEDGLINSLADERGFSPDTLSAYQAVLGLAREKIQEYDFADDLKTVAELALQINDTTLESIREQILAERQNSAIWTEGDFEKVFAMLELYRAVEGLYNGLASEVFENIKELPLYQEELEQSCEQLVAALKQSDPDALPEKIRRVVSLRQQIHHFLANPRLLRPVPATQLKGLDRFTGFAPMEHQFRLFQFDNDLTTYAETLFAQWIEQIREAIKQGTFCFDNPVPAVLYDFAEFISLAELDGVQYAELLFELKEGKLSLGQYRNLFRYFQIEIDKMVKKMNQEMREQAVPILSGLTYTDGLIKEYREIAGNEIGPIAAEKVTEITDMMIGRLINSSYLLMFQEALFLIERALETRPDQPVDRVMKKPKTPKEWDEHFLRFGKDETTTNKPLLLSLWSKKGLHLRRMAAAGIPVSPGVIINSRLTFHPEFLDDEVFREKLQQEVEVIRAKSYYPTLTFSLFARSGSAFTLPGILLTIPNLGISRQDADRLAEQDAYFAYDTYGEFLRAFGIHVLNIPEAEFKKILDVEKKAELSGMDMKEVVNRYEALIEQQKGKDAIPGDLMQQIIFAMKAVYGSWNAEHAIFYREKTKLSDNWGTALILQRGVFGNLEPTADGKISGAGEGTLRRMPNGEAVLQGRFRFRAQGDQLMSRADQNYIFLSKSEKTDPRQLSLQILQPEIHQDLFPPQPSLEILQPEIYRDLLRKALELEELFKFSPRVEFTTQQGENYINQHEDADEQDQYDAPQFLETESFALLGQGVGNYGGAFRGIVVYSIEEARDVMKRLSEHSEPEVDGPVLILPRVNSSMIAEIPEGVALLTKMMSVHEQALAQLNHITTVGQLKEQLEFDPQVSQWKLNGRVLARGDRISLDGHNNATVFPEAGKVFWGTIPVKSGRAKILGKHPGSLPGATAPELRAALVEAQHDIDGMTLTAA